MQKESRISNKDQIIYKSKYLKYFKKFNKFKIKNIKLYYKETVTNYFSIITSDKKYKVVLIQKLLEHLNIKKERATRYVENYNYIDYFKNHYNNLPFNNALLYMDDDIMVFEYIDLVEFTINDYDDLKKRKEMFDMIYQTINYFKVHDLKLTNLFSIKNFGDTNKGIVYFDIDGIMSDECPDQGLHYNDKEYIIFFKNEEESKDYEQNLKWKIKWN